MEHISAVTASPLADIVGSYLTLKEMQELNYPISRRLLRQRLPLEYPTVEAMYKSGFDIPTSVLKRKITLDPAKIKPGDFTQEQIDTIAADILLYGVPAKYTSSYKLYTGLPTWLQYLIVKDVIEQVPSTVLQPLFFDEDNAKLIPRVLKLLYRRNLLSTHPTLYSTFFNMARIYKVPIVITALLDLGYTPVINEIADLDQSLRDYAVERMNLNLPVYKLVDMFERLQKYQITHPRLVRKFKSLRREIKQNYDTNIQEYRDTITQCRREMAHLNTSDAKY